MKLINLTPTKRHLAFVFALLIGVSTQAATIGLTAITVNGDKMVNDSVLAVTWADIQSNNGSWNNANSWVSSLNSTSYGGHNDWRLPTADTSATSYGSSFNFGVCTSSSVHEIGCLFFNELGNQIPNYVNPIAYSNTQPFTSLNYGEFFWTGTLVAGYTSTVNAFNPSHIIHTSSSNMNNQLDPWGNSFKAMAVRTGLTEVAPVPVPASAWLLLSGLGGLGLMSRKRKTLGA